MSLFTQRGFKRLGWPIVGIVAAALVVSTFGVERLTAQQAPALEGAPRSFADIVEEVRPAVVNIMVTKVQEQPSFGQLPGNTPFDEFFDRFFGPGQRPDMPRQRQRRQQGVGSGFIIDSEGYIVTNYHVVSNAEEITATLDSGEELTAEIVGTDEATDLALLKVSSEESLPFLRFGDSDEARVGDWVLAIGNPFALGGTATAGIISARGRNITSGPYEDYLQIDAPINTGNSGGPVFNTSGEVIGVNTAILSPSGGNVGIGFAIPANQAASVITQLRESGNVTRGWLGVQIQSLDEDLAASYGVEPDEGVLIAEVFDDGPAAEAGLQSGDLITSFAGQSVDSARALSRVVAEHQPGERVEVAVLRRGEAREVEVELGTRSEAQQVAARRGGGDRGQAPADDASSLGLELAPLNERARAELGLSRSVQGALIANVEPDSAAAEKGLQRGDVITEVNQMAVTSVEETVEALRTARDNNERALLLIRRGDQQQFVALSFE